MENKFKELRKLYEEVAAINSANGVLQWDQQVYMPSGGAGARARSIGALEEIAHRKFTSPEAGRLIAQTYDWAQGKGHDSFEAGYLRAIKRDYDKAVKLPSEFVAELSRETSLGIEAWTKAKKGSDFSVFSPNLEKLLDLNIRKAELLGFEESPYDALLDLYEPGLKKSSLETLFSKLATGLKPIIKEISSRKELVSNALLKGNFDEDTQLKLVNEITAALGYDFRRGRQDRSAHPMTCDFSIDDVRITTRTCRDYIGTSLYGSIHECGHALYAQNMAPEFEFTPLAGGASLGVHESQSRLWENIIGRSEPFCRWLLPMLDKHFPGNFDNASPEELYKAVNLAEPSLVRVEADEVTYNLHIMLRFELETLLLEKKLMVKDAPELWNEKMREYFGITPKNDAQGVLQDIHWALGMLGYFPTYAIGNLLSAQLFNKLSSEIPGAEALIEKGDFKPVLDWLAKNIHTHGRKYLPEELVKKAVGSELKVEPFLEYIRNKYSKIYGFDSNCAGSQKSEFRSQNKNTGNNKVSPF
ncbi:MAG TPA: carboxypeptidase [Elusimicrobia bacterium]|nr:carboxypeptidase [Elusimicrobiota bacterium]